MRTGWNCPIAGRKRCNCATWRGICGTSWTDPNKRTVPGTIARSRFRVLREIHIVQAGLNSAQIAPDTAASRSRAAVEQTHAGVRWAPRGSIAPGHSEGTTDMRLAAIIATTLLMSAPVMADEI